MKLSACEPPWRIVVVGFATAVAHGVPAAVAGRLATAADLTLREILWPQNPQESLAQLAEGRTGWLAALPIDAGLPLPVGGSWAEALGAWRQPTLLVLGGDQLATGVPAAATALMRQCGVPLLGLVQAGGDWQAGERRRDGLPWLGGLVSAAEDGEPAEVEGIGDGGPEEVLAVMRGLNL
jgi:hypothetical protein